ncbi:MAG: HAD-IIIC family phosphatase [Burkholderiales bacterium]
MTANPPSSPLQVLADRASSLTAVTTALAAAEGLAADRPRVRVGLAANVTLDLLATYLRRHALLEGVRVDVDVGDYDDPIGNVERFARAGADAVLLHTLFDNLLPSFEAQLATLADDAISAKRAEHRERLQVALDRGRSIPRILLVRFHSITRAVEPAHARRVERVVDEFNAMLDDVAGAHPNVALLDLGPCIVEVGARRAFDWRYYFRGKALYSIELLDEYARCVVAGTRAFGTAYRKALVLDCDNTLWGGVIGEDLASGIKLDPFDYPGNVFWRIQHEIAALERQGVLVCLASKNNPGDVDAVLRDHPHMVLRDRHLAVKMLNWDTKDASLRRISEELNIGLDSLVFVDDSAFECELVRSRLPMVRVYEVPKALADYPRMFDEVKAQFLAAGPRAQDAGKTDQYRMRAAAQSERARFASQDEYLASLGIKVVIRCNALDAAPRISELTQKSNQFNLTTRRYTQAQILELMKDPQAAVYSFSVADRFGDSGLTGVAILRLAGATASVDSFLMSCRIIGRGIEAAVFDAVVAAAGRHGASVLDAEYLPTAKNAQVEDFYDRMGMPRVDAPAPARRYRAHIDALPRAAPDWIEVTLGQ